MGTQAYRTSGPQRNMQGHVAVGDMAEYNGRLTAAGMPSTVLGKVTKVEAEHITIRNYCNAEYRCAMNVAGKVLEYNARNYAFLSTACAGIYTRTN